MPGGAATALLSYDDMHTAGEPVRIVTGGYPALKGRTLMAKRRYAREHLDHIRQLLLYEPRGHRDMYGVVPAEADAEDADFAVLFLTNEGYSTMCGHAVLALGRWAVERGLVARREPETRLRIQCPCGVVEVVAQVSGGRVGQTRYTSVPGFAQALDLDLDLEGIGPIRADLAYGGTFYAVAPAAALGVDLEATPMERIKQVAIALTDAMRLRCAADHPENPELSLLYGTILTDGAAPTCAEGSANICIFADGQLDRSPTGTGVAARLALAHARGETAIGELCRYRGPSGESFTGEILSECSVGGHAAVVTAVGGRAYHCGRGEVIVEAADALRHGFLLRR